MRFVWIAVVLCLLPWTSSAGEWREGDSIYVRDVCHTEAGVMEYVTAVTNHGSSNDLGRAVGQLMAEGKCLSVPLGYDLFKITLSEMVVHFHDPGGDPGQVWEAHSYGQPFSSFYVVLRAMAGPHEPAHRI